MGGKRFLSGRSKRPEHQNSSEQQQHPGAPPDASNRGTDPGSTLPFGPGGAPNGPGGAPGGPAEGPQYYEPQPGPWGGSQTQQWGPAPQPPYGQPPQPPPPGPQAPYGQPGYGPDPYGQPYPPPPDAYAHDPYAQQYPTATYQAGLRRGPSNLPRLPWKELFTGIFTRPAETFERMRDHQVWLPALAVSALYGLLVLFGFEDSRDQVFGATFGTLVPILLSSIIGFLVGGLLLGVVTHCLARQLGGDGAWAPTAGLSILVAWLTDAPRLLMALFLPADGTVVQLLGWITWLGCAALLTVMVNRTHDLPWGKALGASSIQLLALLVIIKLPTLS